jgi:hypothetical protein
MSTVKQDARVVDQEHRFIDLVLDPLAGRLR